MVAIGSPLVSRPEAHARPTHHQFIRGIGFLKHSGVPELPPGANGAKNCRPPPKTADGSLHMLQPGNGHPAVKMKWLAAHAAWGSLKPAKGNRLAWPVDHLSKAGWEYVGPAK